MPPIIPEIESLRISGDRWVYAIFGLLIGLLVFMPVTFGAVEAWSELIVILGAAGLSVCLGLRVLVERQFRFVLTWLYVPLGLFLLLVAFQLVSLPVGWVEVLSPATSATVSRLLDGSAAPVSQMSLSFYPRDTVHGLSLVLVGTTIFLVVVNTFRDVRRIAQLLTVILGIGCGEAILALVQIATLASQIYWTYGAEGGRVVTAGSFVNYSHYSQFMNLSLGAGVALLLIRLHERNPADMVSKRASPLGHIHWDEHGWLLAGIVLCGVSVLTSMSRNGAISLLVASVVVGTALYRRGSLSWKGWLLVVLPVGVLASLFLVGFDAFYERLATLQGGRDLDGRWEMTVATLRAWQEFPIWGSGLGTHEYVFPMFDTSVTTSIAAHADNDYAQLLEETGLVGAALVGAFLIGVVGLCCKLMFWGRTPLSAAAFGLGLGLLAVSIHSASDFGQHLPAVFSLSAITCGLLVAIGRIEQKVASGELRVASGEKYTSFLSRNSHLATRFSLFMGLLLLWGWVLYGAYATYQGEQWWAVALEEEARMQQENWQGTDQEFTDLIAAAERAAACEPTNVKYGYWLNSYRWQSLSRAIDSETGQILLHPDILGFVKQIADEVALVRRLCPTYGPPYALEGELRLFVLGEKVGGNLIRQGYELASYDPSTCFLAGSLAVREGQTEEAHQQLRRAVQLNSAYYGEVIKLFLFKLERSDWAQSLAGDDYDRLKQLAALCAEDERFAEFSENLLAEAEVALRRRTTTEDATAGELATQADIDFRAGDFELAVNLYRRSLALDYSQIGRRMNLAQALAEVGSHQEAIHEARICLRLKPGLEAARQMIGRLSLLVEE